MANEAPFLYQGRLRPLDSAQLLDTENPELRCLPGAHHSGEWLPLRSLASASNTTVYSNATFLKLQKLYTNLKAEATPQHAEALQSALAEAYSPLAGSPFVQAHGKALFYPSIAQLKVEKLYTHIPMAEASIAFYAAAALLLLARWRKGGLLLLALGFFVHTILLLSRCFILQRPPVSNMFETVLYVPWIAAGVAYFLARRSKSVAILAAAALFAAGLLLLLKLSRLHDGLDNVQAVLDSQFWLAVHVLMVVGSYGLFALGALIGHLYVLTKNRETLQTYGKILLQCLYFGVALLIPGTILGGVWAAESWGRFWDWDPKESWAFISSCVYLIWIHAYRFGHIADFGLALGAIIGFQAITFTWYGVNYILGAGLHSYGFGQGGELYYYLFLFIELLFIIGAVILRKRRHEAH